MLTFEATIEKGWHLYSQFTPDGGPAPLQLQLTEMQKFSRRGKARESTTHTAYNKIFGVDETFFIETATIKQVVKASSPSASTFRVRLAYQICKQVCVPQEITFEFDAKSLRAKQVLKK